MSYTNEILAQDVSTVKQLSLFLKNGTFIVSLAAIAQVYVISVFLSIQLNAAVGIAPLLAFGVYGINNLTDSEEDFVNQPWNSQYSRRWNRFIGVLSVVLHFVGVGIAFYYGSLVAGLLSLIPLTAQLVYSSAWLPFKEIKRLKQVLVLNSFIVAGAWVVKVVALPIALTTNHVPLDTAIAAGLFIFVRWFMSVEVANVPDIHGDISANVDSVPIKYGIDGTRRIMYGLEILSALVLSYLLVTVETPIAVLVVLPILVYTATAEYLFCREGWAEYLSISWDVSFVLMGIVVAGADFLTGLPGGFF
ncbi:UbiA family prenyltransferase [Natrinema ejinorense]|uniref:Prenyltransferase n=1 Tax=Natrinema ejinorense TaxID=373386 RepID=A0A2A5QS05_9EURY|nr:UbiA family prenyltransferase [Natrinema ejinorense]PCR89585.1 hypothetical protein CP557_02975 [Natrinema ejinorense]